MTSRRALQTVRRPTAGAGLPTLLARLRSVYGARSPFRRIATIARRSAACTNKERPESARTLPRSSKSAPTGSRPTERLRVRCKACGAMFGRDEPRCTCAEERHFLDTDAEARFFLPSVQRKSPNGKPRARARALSRAGTSRVGRCSRDRTSSAPRRSHPSRSESAARFAPAALDVGRGVSQLRESGHKRQSATGPCRQGELTLKGPKFLAGKQFPGSHGRWLLPGKASPAASSSIELPARSLGSDRP